MNKKTIKDLVELGIFESRTLTKEDYNNLSNNNTDDSLIYMVDTYENENGNQNCYKYYKEINTHGLTDEEVMLQLEIDKSKNIKSIKNMILFFVIITVISIILMFFGGASLLNMLP